MYLHALKLTKHCSRNQLKWRFTDPLFSDYLTVLHAAKVSFKESNNERFTFAMALGLALFSNRKVATLSLL